MATNGHRPVLLEESLQALAIRPDGVYLDATFGRSSYGRRSPGLRFKASGFP